MSLPGELRNAPRPSTDHRRRPPALATRASAAGIHPWAAAPTPSSSGIAAADAPSAAAPHPPSARAMAPSRVLLDASPSPTPPSHTNAVGAAIVSPPPAAASFAPVVGGGLESMRSKSSDAATWLRRTSPLSRRGAFATPAAARSARDGAVILAEPRLGPLAASAATVFMMHASKFLAQLDRASVGHPAVEAASELLRGSVLLGIHLCSMVIRTASAATDASRLLHESRRQPASASAGNSGLPPPAIRRSSTRGSDRDIEFDMCNLFWAVTDMVHLLAFRNHISFRVVCADPAAWVVADQVFLSQLLMAVFSGGGTSMSAVLHVMHGNGNEPHASLSLQLMHPGQRDGDLLTATEAANIAAAAAQWTRFEQRLRHLGCELEVVHLDHAAGLVADIRLPVTTVRPPPSLTGVPLHLSPYRVPAAAPETSGPASDHLSIPGAGTGSGMDPDAASTSDDDERESLVRLCFWLMHGGAGNCELLGYFATEVRGDRDGDNRAAATTAAIPDPARSTTPSESKNARGCLRTVTRRAVPASTTTSVPAAARGTGTHASTAPSELMEWNTPWGAIPFCHLRSLRVEVLPNLLILDVPRPEAGLAALAELVAVHGDRLTAAAPVPLTPTAGQATSTTVGVLAVLETPDDAVDFLAALAGQPSPYTAAAPASPAVRGSAPAPPAPSPVTLAALHAAGFVLTVMVGRRQSPVPKALAYLSDLREQVLDAMDEDDEDEGDAGSDRTGSDLELSAAALASWMSVPPTPTLEIAPSGSPFGPPPVVERAGVAAPAPKMAAAPAAVDTPLPSIVVAEPIQEPRHSPAPIMPPGLALVSAAAPPRGPLASELCAAPPVRDVDLPTPSRRPYERPPSDPDAATATSDSDCAMTTGTPPSTVRSGPAADQFPLTNDASRAAASELTSVPRPHPPPASHFPPLRSQQRVIPKIRVLLVEDNPINLRILTSFLSSRGITYACARDGAEAVRKFAAAPPGSGTEFHLVLMDLQLPVLDGLEATRRMRAIEDCWPAVHARGPTVHQQLITVDPPSPSAVPSSPAVPSPSAVFAGSLGAVAVAADPDPTPRVLGEWNQSATNGPLPAPSARINEDSKKPMFARGVDALLAHADVVPKERTRARTSSGPANFTDSQLRQSRWSGPGDLLLGRSSSTALAASQPASPAVSPRVPSTPAAASSSALALATPGASVQQQPTASGSSSSALFRCIVVALTASSSTEDRRNAINAGCNDFVSKPVNLRWLESKIIEWGSIQALIRFELPTSLSRSQQQKQPVPSSLIEQPRRPPVYHHHLSHGGGGESRHESAPYAASGHAASASAAGVVDAARISAYPSELLVSVTLDPAVDMSQATMGWERAVDGILKSGPRVE
ncbi:Two-component response regulator SSK1p [Blastocladiella emersonii ATCC 22665]|nr:Two-component response regulator SSK1p [Blastocladiella emersonii ATCC 22665]